ncbi:MAG: flagellar biosynthetic protein FliR [Deltaproteobacteria bacterium]|nr:flagellar biosynthetic protein FliR [Deltaproteobacteria bacterium]
MALGELSQLLWGIEPSAAAAALISLLARLAPLIWIAPVFGGRLVPTPIRLGFALSLALLILPALAPQASQLGKQSSLFLTAIFVKEVCVGFSIGFLVALVFWAVQSTGALIDSARGASNAETLVLQSGERSTPFANFHVQLAVVLFFAIGGHRLAIRAIVSSYQAIPLARWLDIASLGQFSGLVIRLTADLFVLSLSLAAPVIVALLLTDLALGVINRFVPQINVFFLAMPLKAALGIAVVAVAGGLWLIVWPEVVSQAMSQIERALALF